jgi:hypothetical protein
LRVTLNATGASDQSTRAEESTMPLGQYTLDINALRTAHHPPIRATSRCGLQRPDPSKTPLLLSRREDSASCHFPLTLNILRSAINVSSARRRLTRLHAPETPHHSPTAVAPSLCPSSFFSLLSVSIPPPITLPSSVPRCPPNAQLELPQRLLYIHHPSTLLYTNHSPS